MAELLRTGHRMLNIACPICNNPIFQKKQSGLKFCPVCNREVIISDKPSENQENTSEFKNTVLKDETTNLENDLLSEMKMVIKKKLSFFSEKLEQEDQFEDVEKIIKILRALLDLYFYK